MRDTIIINAIIHGEGVATTLFWGGLAAIYAVQKVGVGGNGEAQHRRWMYIQYIHNTHTEVTQKIRQRETKSRSARNVIRLRAWTQKV